MTMEPDGTRSVQWGTGSSNASSADTTTGQTAATPSPKPPPRDSTSASVDALPSSVSAGQQGYLVKVTNEVLEGAEVWPVSFCQPETQAERNKRQTEAHAQRFKEFIRLRLEYPTLDPILKLHSPSEYGECQGCDGGPDYSGDWPCRTIETIKEEF